MLSSWLMVHNLINRAYKTMPPQSPHSVQVGGHVEVLEGRVPQEGTKACTPTQPACASLPPGCPELYSLIMSWDPSECTVFPSSQSCSSKPSTEVGSWEPLTHSQSARSTGDTGRLSLVPGGSSLLGLSPYLWDLMLSHGVRTEVSVGLRLASAENCRIAWCGGKHLRTRFRRKRGRSAEQ